MTADADTRWMRRALRLALRGPGRTSPNPLVGAVIARAVAAVEDPNPQVSGNGVRKLQEAGIEVEVGLLRDEARRLNAPYFKHTTTGLPLVSLKAAMSLDGKIATSTGDSQWITGDTAAAVGHR